MWPALLERLAGGRAAAWVKYLRLDRFEGDTAVLTPLPGHGNVCGFATPARLEPIAAELAALRGVPTRIVVESGGQRSGARGRSSEGGGQRAELRRQGAEDRTGGGRGERPPAREQTNSFGGSASPPFDRRAAAQVPLVRQALQFFPEAVIINAQEEKDPPPAKLEEGS